MTEQLKPCPFCGCEAEYYEDTQWQDKHVVECSMCGCQKRYEYDKEGVIEAWNNRPSPWVPVSDWHVNGEAYFCWCPTRPFEKATIRKVKRECGTFLAGAHIVTHVMPINPPEVDRQ